MSSTQVTRHNHYVPIWYQKGFVIAPAIKIQYLDLDPPKTQLPDGRVIVAPELLFVSPKRCFQEEDLYTTRFGDVLNDEVERFLFGKLDSSGATAVRAFAKNDGRGIHDHFQKFFEYLDAQKLRTPKGLDWIKRRYPTLTQLDLMLEMQHLRRMHCTMWYECVREVVSAENSDVKFIVTDHPVTTYNVGCLPTSTALRYPEEPSISLNGTQTVFALDADHCIILTNLDYAKGPAAVDPMAQRQNARYSSPTITRTDRIIRERKLSRDEVVAINLLLKTRARRYIGAGNKDWLFPERSSSVAWTDIAKILLPPGDSLSGFGGEIYIGYQDGSTHYQDAFGRTDTSHKYLRKKDVTENPGANDLCGCGSGRVYRKCCRTLPKQDRPPWDVYGLRDRNKIFCNAVMDILGLDKEKTWDDVRKELTDDQVKRIHEIHETLWPKETNLAELLPAPDRRVFRAVYLGLVDPRTIVASVVSSLAYFDEIVVLNPFPNPAYMNAEYSPTLTPGQHKAQTLKNVSVLLALMPFIRMGVVHLVPDPAEFNADFRRSIMTMTEERTKEWEPNDEEMRRGKALARDDMERDILRMPEDYLLRKIRERRPDIDPESLEQTLQGMKEKLASDQLALLQPLGSGEDGGELRVFRAINLELGLYFAHLTGSAPYTDDPAMWRQLHEHTSAAEGPQDGWTPLSEKLRSRAFPVEINAAINWELRNAGKLVRIRRVFRQIWNSARTLENVGADVETLAAALDRARAKARSEWDQCSTTTGPSVRFQRNMELSVPRAAFHMNGVRRLLITFGRTNHLESIPLAIFLKFDSVEDEIAAQ